MNNEFNPTLVSIVRSKKFEIFLGILTLSSVVLALLFYIPGINLSDVQTNGIYVFDVIVVIALAFDFCVRATGSNRGLLYAAKHAYEIPAMIPLVAFAVFEDPLFLGAAVRSIRFIRLFRLVRLFRLANLFRAAEHWKLSSFVYLIIILIASVTFGAIGIYSVEENNETIQDFEDALWFSVTTLTISGFGDVVPETSHGRIIATVLSFIGLGIILGFISNVGSGLVASRLGRTQKRLHNETRELIRNKIDNLDQLQDDDVAELISIINSLYQRTKNLDNTHQNLCSACKASYTDDSIYCNKCGQKI